MSFFTLLNYLHNEAHKDENTQKLWKSAAEKIEENERLEISLKEKYEQKCQLEMQLYTLELIAEQRAKESEQQKLAEQACKESYASCLQLSELLERVDLQKIFGYELQTQQLQLQDELQKMEQTFVEKRKMYEAMENRHCVQKLRQQQREHSAAQAELEMAKNAATVANEKVLKNLATAKKLRNDMIIRLVEGGKELSKLREKIRGLDDMTYEEARLEQKKIELTKKLQKLELQEKKKQPAEAMAITLEQTHIEKVKTKDESPEPTSFFKSVLLGAKKMPSMWEYFAQLQAQKQIEAKPKQIEKPIEQVSEANTSLRSILRTQNSSMDTNLDLTPKHVHFTLTSENKSNAANPPPPRSATPTKPFKEAAVPMITDETEETPMSIIDLNTPTAEIDSESMNVPSPEYELLSGDEMDANGECTKIGETKRPTIEIQECRIVKPAGTALPKVLPTTLSPEVQCVPATEFSGTQPQPTFKVPPPPAAPSKSSDYPHFFDEFYKCTDSDSLTTMAEPKHEIFNEKTENKPKKQHQLKGRDFESLVKDSMVDLMVSDEASVEGSDDDMLNMGQNEEMFDFNTEEVDDKFSLEFNDFDRSRNNRNNQDFL